VFDEADRMFDMGFRDDMKYILRRVPRDRQFLLFSATLNFDVLNTAYQFGSEPVEFNVSRDQVTAEGVDHEILHVGQLEKPQFLISILKKNNPKQCSFPTVSFLEQRSITCFRLPSLFFSFSK
jgi:ATP-dependent RNA helicase RhlB